MKIISHTILFALYPILFLFAENTDEVVVGDIIVPAMLSLGLTALVYGISWLLYRDSGKASIFTSFFLLLFFSYGHIFEPENGLYWIRHRYLLTIWVVLFGAGMYGLWQTTRNTKSFSAILNIIAVVLVAGSLFQIGSYMFRVQNISTNGVYAHLDTAEHTNAIITAKENTGIRPDIYYIILDAYASADILKEVGYDNTAFLAFLEDREFYVVPHSFSNYSATHLSLASSLNMDHIATLSTEPGFVTKETIDHRTLIEANRVRQFLQEQGYEFIQFNSHWHATFKNRFADENVSVGYMPEFLNILYQTTAVYPIGEKFDAFNPRNIQYRRIKSHLDYLPEIAKRDGPTFVFAHLIVPHPPYVFDRNGNFIQDEQETEEELRMAYIEQVMFINKQLARVVDEILSESKTPPIIILQGDHGSRLEDKTAIKKESELTDWFLKERLGALNAYYLPNGGQKALYEGMTPVNTFRVLFNYYFGTSFELRPDDSYLAPPWSDGYDIINVTEQIREK
ncbi:MAG: hypothetical protein COU90_02010 [Candidatus Ryanbacteria bacterium CG10_big_fil_rev_8_21_14_0_10_43_42]|uniref:Sulfatase N-terminal domain-containing protein n=1 Tax=Candidatus Ryanbacteria bacterium CG10_big_fil_rev_8_21_14_0_10_43_42 TaxID=1974864 RepID=A0A2M8KXI7_9BACT|nr:MAG: hypothetical protein COU90_02010 [Candidatus Ryanbacteria bacterium CG10_big_fil_rev_8_21_14_0_10_43_42]